MNFSKVDIVKNISKKSLVSAGDAASILESFLLSIKNKSKSRIVKLSGFGSFGFKKTPERLGRNPNTKKTYIIEARKRLIFRASNKIKGKLN